MEIYIDGKKFITIDEAAELLRVHKSYLYQLVHRKKIPYYKPFGYLFFDPVEIESFIRDSRVEPVEVETEANKK